MIQSFPTARHRLALMLVLLPALSAPLVEAHAAKDEDRRALSLDEVERQESQSSELRQQAEAARLEAIQRLGELARDAEGDRKAEMLLRLAMLYFEQGKAEYFEEMEKFTKQYDDCFNTAKNADECDRLQPDNAGSFAWYGKAIKLYESILKGYPRYARADEATFYLGQTYLETKQQEPALEAFKKLVKLYPQSTYLPDAYVQIGEYYFEHNEAFSALKAYTQAAAHPESPRYAYAKYKLAWCYYNVEEFDKAIDELKSVVAFSDPATSASTGNKNTVRLYDEALKDLVRFFADAGDLDAAYEYFKGLGKPDLFVGTLKRLAAQYMEAGKFEFAIETYRRLIAEKPNAPENPGYVEEIIGALRKLNNKDAVIAEIRSLRSNYGKSSSWWRANSANPDAQASADGIIEKVLRTTALEFNREARELKKARHPSANAAFDKAVAAYEEYMAEYATNPNSYNVHYDFGNLLESLARPDEAYREFMAVLKIDPKGQYSQFSAEHAIYAAEDMVKKEGGGQIEARGVKVTKDIQPIPLTEWEKRLIDACKTYATLFPGASDKIEIAIYKSAFLLYQRFHFADAADQFRAVIAMNPKSENAQYSAHLILDALNIREEWASLRDTSRAFYEQPALGNDKFKKEMYGIWSAASFTVIEEDFKAKGDKLATADAFVAFSKQFPDFDKVDLALNNAAVYYYQANRVASSMEVRHILVEDARFVGKSKYFYPNVAALGFDYERLADFDNAVKYYDQLFELYPAERKKVSDAKPADLADQLAKLDEQAAAAIYSSAVLHDAIGDWQGAITRYRKFITGFPTDGRVTETRLVIARLYEDNKDWVNAQTAFLDFYTKDVKDASPDMEFFARLHQGRALIAQNKGADAIKLYRASVDRYKQLLAKGLPKESPATEFAAEMMFELSKAPAASYMALTIRGAGRGAGQRAEDRAFADSLKAKITAYVEMEKTYQGIIDTGAGVWGLASLIGVGRVYENLAQTLRSSPCPYYLTEDQCELYRLQIEDKAFVQVEKSVEAYKLALDKAFELQIYNDDTAFATRRLGELRPSEYPGLFEIVPEAGLTSDTARSFEPETSL